VDLVLRAESPEAAELIHRFAEALAGRSNFAPELVRGVQLRVAMVLQSLVAQSFLTKSRGGSDDTGEWAPLKKETIANRRRGPGDPKPKSQGPRPYLTASFDKEWRKIFATRKAWLMGKFGMGEQEAGALAAAQAWATVKRMGGQTKLEALGNRSVETGRDTGRLFASLSPGVSSPDAIMRLDLGAIVVGSNVSYAAGFHAKRPLWPRDGRIPSSWQQPLLDAMRRGITEAVALLLSRSGAA